jgi:CRISPR-associated endonuclease/helicase Cas3
MLWGKWGGDGSSRYPLEAHLIDTAAFAKVLCDHWVPPPLLATAAARLGTDRDGVVRLVVTAAGLHDIGKATAVFQQQLLALSPPGGIDAHRAALEAAGLESPDPAALQLLDDEGRRWVRRHEVASAVMLHGDLEAAGASGTAALVAGHHGLWDIPDPYDPYSTVCGYHRLMLSHPAWAAQRDRIIATVVETTGADPGLPVPDVTVVPLLTGLVVLADWLASDLADRQADEPLTDDWPTYHRRQLVRATDMVADLLSTPVKPAGGFVEVFGFAPNRPVQQQLVKQDAPGLRIVVVPTGDGKTEAALGHWLVNAADKQGIFFGLPTMATADAMFARVRAMFEGTDAFGALAHSRSLLNQFYADLDRPLGGETHDDGDARLQPGRWFHGNRRAVLAPVAVGTADQLILAAVRHRHNFLRMLGAATKTVVFDEVHSYDPYMGALLERFLVWAGAWGIDTVLLSATLPTERVEAYTTAYGGTPPTEMAYPSVVTVRRDGSTATAVLDASDAARTLSLEHHTCADVVAGVTELVRALRGKHPNAKIGVIVNTVSRCQSVAAALAGRTGAAPIDGDVHVMHARFPANTRARHVTDAVDSYGKTSSNGPAVMVATQVVEQSVDLDFDVLITELCPAPSLLQRAGRLHRHGLTGRSRTRPGGCRQPVMHVVTPAAVHDRPVELWPWLPYPAASVLRTFERGLDQGERTSLVVPDEVQQFVDTSHVRLDELSGDEPLAQELENELFDRIVHRQSATANAVPTPTELRRNPARGLERYASRDDDQRLQTRWIDRPSFDVLLLNGGSDTWQQRLPDHPSQPQIRELLGCVVQLPFQVSQAPGRVEALARPAGWDRTLLADVGLLDLTDHPTARLDPLLGFVTTKSKATDA